MSGNTVGTVLGAAIGAALGSWKVGAIVGGYLGGVLDPTIIKGPSIGDAQQQFTQAGSPIPKCFGHTYPIGVTLIDGDEIARKVTRTQDVGKGATQKTETEHFIATRAFLVCEGEISGFYRITRNGKLVYSTVPGDELEADSASFASQLTIYTGSETQGPDPSLEAIHGVGNTHYYRGRSYFVVRDDEEIGGAMNRYMVEVASCGTVTDHNPATAYPQRIDLSSGTSSAGMTSDNGVTINLEPGQTLTLQLVAGTYTSWMERPDPIWRCRFKVEDAEHNITDHYADCNGSTQAAAFALGLAAAPVVLSGSSSYTLWIYDTDLDDNVGGVSIDYTISGAPAGMYELPDLLGMFVDEDGVIDTDSVPSTSIDDCTPMWKEVVAEIAYRASPLLPAVLDIDHMTDEVPGFVLGNPSLMATDYVRTLCMYYFVDLVEYDAMLHAVRRGGPVVATFTEDDLLEVEEEDDDTREEAIALGYKRVTVMYPDPANKYVATPQTSPRTSPDITTSNTVTLECPIPFDAETMARKADILQKIAFLEIEGGFKRAFPAEFSQYVPSDPVMFNDRRYLIRKASYDDSMVRFEGQYDRPSAYTSLATPSVAPAPSPQASNLKGPTILVAMNLPPLRTADSAPGITVAAMGLLPGWPGCDVMLSLDGGITEAKVAEILNPAEIGELADDFVVGSGSEPAVVRLYGSGELESVSPAQITARQNAAAVITAGVAEIIQFQTVEQDTSGHWLLMDISRGVLGTTEDEHVTADRFVTLANAIFIPIDAGHLGETLILRGVTKGTAAANNPTISLVYETGEVVIDGGEIT